ncbi:rod shape-determining protein MreD [soil metagenome]
MPAHLGVFQPDRTLGRAHQILRPVSPLFIAFSLFVALMLDLAPWGRLIAVPDWVAVVLVFWNMHQPRKVGIGVAFALGLIMDVHDAALLGEHALAFTLLSYGAITMHRRVTWLSLGVQMGYVFVLLVAAQATAMLVRMVAGDPFPGFWPLLDSVTGAIIWPVLSWLLVVPQRRSVDRDATRPL